VERQTRRNVSALGIGAAATFALGAIVTWRLVSATVRHDLVTICDAEVESGGSLRRGLAGVSEWTRDRLRTPEGQRLFASLRDSPMAERAALLADRARAEGIASCPVAETYAALAREAAYRVDMQGLCSYVTFPGFADLDEASRVAAIEAWVRERGTSPRTDALVRALRAASSAGERALALRLAAAEIDVLTCDIAGVAARPAVVTCEADR
jgi:hypothetical protein